MTMIGYARVSTEDQTIHVQTDALRAAGCDEVFEERASGGSRTRAQLARALARVGRGDTLMVVRIDRLARSLSHLLAVIESLRARGAHFRSLGNPIDTSSPQGLFTLQVLGAAAEFERELIRERTRAGLAAARARGRIGGNPGLRARDPAALRRVAAARRDATLAGLIADAENWLPTVRRLRPDHPWGDVVQVLNSGLDPGRARWSEARLIRAVRRFVAEGLADAALLIPAPRRRPPDRLVAIAAGIARANPTLSLRAIAAQLEAMRERTPRGSLRWASSSVAHLLARAAKAGMLDHVKT
ncbi:recombinase family protein [Limobrevibacterium gyesilva]|uniref:Recombinase family protein n=1 Tax=Limobrevibacterium gyesilva TaxID=2991712 RepID=A0AA41YUU9_9PROT|nr:recombinase family protein [Limobrevibacterium gyesilva]MCW3476905.1 recombinase family protein [Limobrevibacterium gyesilva]